ncbi:hypothetical protein EJB05_10739 [Eragrostis curvula]|uniref:SGNH hydrolase-type esterase domain-containing protein n=1 Tax=Eragrostis curvula TaxID=38414 RepID=A0A5J9VPM2_9POAL|nr:hypothetical protein EJB05_10739 [Eragrostis curvula]
MKNIVLFAACFLLLLSGALVEGGRRLSNRSHRRHRSYKMFVFGDSFVDVGNVPSSWNNLTSRGWNYPYGSSDSAHNYRATGRFSDGMVQADFVANILGLDESPPAYRTLGPNADVDASGVNFAVGSTGVLLGTPTLGQQVEQMRALVRSGAIEKRDLEHSVALISTSAGKDYGRISGESTTDDMMALSRGVTDGIKDVVKQLQNMGVSKVLVNSMPPMGCTPWEAVHNNYTHCESRGNMVADVHNTALRQRLDAELEDGGVLLLDLNYIIKGILQDGGVGQGQFTSKFSSCCHGTVSGAYCGQVDSMGRPQYIVCGDRDRSFYWDYMHPSQAAWNAIMRPLEDRIKDFIEDDES